ncbi:MAG TPA: phosphatase PAP2 family protein [Rickettsiales bacterium]|nr:phosphatase PAP2 family protein [Rickettsiales bacterium]
MITDIGDSAVLGGIALAGAAYLAWAGCRKGAAAMAASFLGAGIFIGLLKLLFIGCDGYWRNYNITSPSGHAALSMAVLGTFGLLVGSQWRGIWRHLPFLGGIALAIAIAATRVELGAHTVTEVIVGIAVGSMVLACIHAFVTRSAIPRFNSAALILTIMAAAVVLHGFRMPAEILLRFIAEHIKTYVSMCGNAKIKQ